MKIFTYIKKYPERFLILSLTGICLVFLLYIGYVRYRLNNWYDRYIDKTQPGVRAFYYNNREWRGAIEDTEVIKWLSYSDSANKRFQRKNFSLRAIGIFSSPKRGRYKFFLNSDDGGRLFIDRDLIIDNSGIHPAKEIARTIHLGKGCHLVVIEYFQARGRALLDFSWLKTVETKRSKNLELFFYPAIHSFQWDEGISRFEGIIKLRENVNIYSLLISCTVIVIWFIARFYRNIYSLGLLIWEARNYPPIQYFVRLVPLVAVLASGILLYKGVISSTGPAFDFGSFNDIQALVFPKYYFIRKAFIEGEIPFWDTHTFLGQPGIVSMGLAMSYPLLLGFLSMGFLGPLLPRHLELFIVGHFLLSGITMYWGARRLGMTRLGASLAGIVFQTAIANRDLVRSVPIALGLPWVPLAVSFGISLFKSKEPALSKNNFFSLLITVSSLFLLISTTYPSLIVYTFITVGITIAFYIVSNLLERSWPGAVEVLTKAVWVSAISLLLSTVIILPGYILLKDSIRFNASPPQKLWPLYHWGVWTILFPRVGNSINPPFAYTGVIIILLAAYFCITKRNNRADDSFIFVIFAMFWFYHAIHRSLLERWITHIPMLGTLRIPAISMVIYAYSVSVLAGKGLERMCRFSDYKIRPNINWLFPFFILSALVFTAHHLVALVRHGFSIGSPTALIFGCIFILYLIFQRPIRSNAIMEISCSIILVTAFLEIFIASPPVPTRSEGDVFSPYRAKLDKFADNFPEAFINNDLYRIENFNEYPMAEYYFGRFSTNGFIYQGTQPARYYYLWDRSGRFEGDYTKILTPLDSRPYDLAGVKYFYLPEHEILFIDYRRSGEGEWIEVVLRGGVLVSGIGIYNRQNPTDRRIYKAEVLLNGVDKIAIDIPDTPGWHRFYFKPVILNKLKIVADEVSQFELGQGTAGVVIAELEFLDKYGRKIDVPVKEFNASSSMVASTPWAIMDNRLENIWESWCDVIAGRTLPGGALERVGKGCYINKDVLPRVFIVHRYKYIKDETMLFQELHSEQFDPAEALLLKGETVYFDIPEGPYLDKARIINYKLNKVEISTNNNKSGFLVLTDIYSPGWEVFVDGRKEEILIADGLFRGVFINEGAHKVLFKYNPPLLKLGFSISLLTALVLAGIALRYVPII